MRPGTKVLIVEDEAILAALTKESLTAAGYAVCRIAYNSRAAIDLALGERPDVVIMDVRLGRGLDGIETASMLRESGVEAPIVFVTGETDAATRQRITRIRAASILPKPVLPGELEAALDQALRPQIAPSSPR
jgi:DNA-binding response OmpR family regulator